MKPTLVLACLAQVAVLMPLVPAAGATAPEPLLRSSLRPAPPVVCRGNQDVQLVRRLIVAEGDGVIARGNCGVTLRECVVEAGGIAIRAADNAGVRIYDSEISGAGGSLRAAGLAEIYFEGSTIQGRMRTAGMAELSDGGGNTVEGGGRGANRVEASEPAESGSVRVGDIEVDASGVRIGGVDVVEIDDEGVRIGGRGVVIDEDGVAVGGEGVVVTESGVRVGGETVVIEEGGAVSVVDGDEVVVIDRDGNVRYDSADGTILASGDWRQSGAVYGDVDGVLVELGAKAEADSIRVNLAGDVVFDFDSTVIREQAAATLSKLAHVIRRRATGRVTVTGHTDSIGTSEYNQQLSEKRALAVMTWLHRVEGIPLGLMVGRGAGASQPVDYNTMPDGSDNPAGRARNRRVELRIATGS